VPTTTADVTVSADPVRNQGGLAGVATNLDSATSPTAGLVAYLHYDYYNNPYVRLDKFTTASTWTRLISVSTTYSAGATLQVKTYHSDANTLKVSVYYNGAQVGTEQTVTDAGIINNTIHGMFSTYSGNTLDNFTLKSQQINNDYCVPGDTAYCGAPVAEWKMDEGTGTSAYDTSGNNNTGTLTNGPTWTNGKIGKAVNFDGSDDFVDVGSGPTAVNTVEFWVKPVTTTEYFVDLNGSAYVSASSGAVSATGFTTPTYYINGVATASPTLTAGTWTHVAVTTGTGLNATDLDLGRIEGVGNLEGQLDQIQIYNYARTPAQVAWDYNRGGPVAHYKFDETSGTTAYDSGTGAVNGTNSGATISTNCKLQNCLSFDGSDDYVAVTSTASINAVSFWMKQSSTANKSIIYLDGTHSVTLASNAITAGGFSSPTIYVDGKAGSTVSDTNWHQVTITTATAFTLSSPTIGKVGSSYFTGYLDDVRLYGYALTATQVRDLYTGGAVRY